MMRLCCDPVTSARNWLPVMLTVPGQSTDGGEVKGYAVNTFSASGSVVRSGLQPESLKESVRLLRRLLNEWASVASWLVF